MKILALLFASICIAGAQTLQTEDEPFSLLFEKAQILTRVTHDWNVNCVPVPTDKDKIEVCTDIKIKLEEQMALFIERAAQFRPAGSPIECDTQIRGRIIEHFSRNFAWNLQFGGGRLIGKSDADVKKAIELRVKLAVDQTQLQQDIDDCAVKQSRPAQPKAIKISERIP